VQDVHQAASHHDGSPIGTFVNGPPGTSGAPANAIAVDSLGDVWVASSATTVVNILNPVGAVHIEVPVGIGPEALAVDGTHMWVANKGSDNVTEVNPDGSVAATVSLAEAGSTTAPDAITFDGTHLWVALGGIATVAELAPG
jgi:hypothetical protein